MKKFVRINIFCITLVLILLCSYSIATDNTTLPLFYLNRIKVLNVSVQKYNGDEIYNLNADETKQVCAYFSQMRLKRCFRKIEKAPLKLTNPVVYTFETNFGQIEIYEAISIDTSDLYEEFDNFYWINEKPYGTLLSYSSSNIMFKRSLNEVTLNLGEMGG